jgi:hypothetical protein
MIKEAVFFLRLSRRARSHSCDLIGFASAAFRKICNRGYTERDVELSLRFTFAICLRVHSTFNGHACASWS